MGPDPRPGVGYPLSAADPFITVVSANRVGPLSGLNSPSEQHPEQQVLRLALWGVSMK